MYGKCGNKDIIDAILEGMDTTDVDGGGVSGPVTAGDMEDIIFAKNDPEINFDFDFRG